MGFVKETEKDSEMVKHSVIVKDSEMEIVTDSVREISMMKVREKD